MINIVCAANRAYLQHLSAMLASVFMNTKEQITVHILNNNFTNEDKRLIVNVFEPHCDAQFEFYTINDEVLSDINVAADHLTIQTLYRLLVANLLPNSIDKVLYLDSDIIVEADIQDLFNIDLEDYYVAATNEISFKLTKVLGLTDLQHYFNAGVLLINLKKWRDTDFWSQCKEFAIHNADKIVYGDQDILNGYLQGQWKRFELKWNYTTNIKDQKDLYSYFFNQDEVDFAINIPSIIHFIGGMKPWNAFSSHPYKTRYFHYLDHVQYPYIKFPELGFLKEKNVVLFGAGALGVTFLERMKQLGIEVTAFCDNSPQKWNTNYYNVNVISPVTLMELTNPIVFITSMYHMEIREQLLELGMIENEQFCEISSIWKLNLI